MRNDCLFCSYWWKCLPLLFKRSFHNMLKIKLFPCAFLPLIGQRKMNYDGLVYILLKYETSSWFKALGIGSIEFQYNSSIQIHGLQLKFCE